LLPELDADEDDEKDAENREQRDDATVGPRVRAATPLQGELLEFCSPAAFELLRGLVGRVVEEGDEDEGDCSDGQVDVEAPAPGDFVGEGTALSYH
jgi:hypothetical protein